MAILHYKLGGASVRDNLLYLFEVDNKGAMAAYHHRIGA